eukprot:TRINITY_DN2052_c0_g1_i4.p1 TRINITY_DN2052_c0_g1~~TRINITY_DN2052_c0_g1_i4.p1  ORF type:complete len:566 (-),score=162.35 TRINITY_DN2052_c0_g1_i4:231-1928(-)
MNAGFLDELNEWVLNDTRAQNKGIHIVKRAIWDLGLGEELMKAVVKGGPKFETATTERLFDLLNFSCESRSIVEVVLEMGVIPELLQLVVDSLQTGRNKKLEALEEMSLETLCLLSEQSADLCFEMADKHGMLLQILELSSTIPNVHLFAVELYQQICSNGGSECVMTLTEDQDESEALAMELLQFVSSKEDLGLVLLVLQTLHGLGKTSMTFREHLKRVDVALMLKSLLKELDPMMRTNRAARKVAEQAEGLQLVLQAGDEADGFNIGELVEEKKEWTDDSAALKLQSVFRGHQVRKEQKREQKRKERAAVKVQARARGMIARREFEQRKTESEFDRERTRRDRRIQKQMNTLKDLENTPADQVSAWKGMEVHLTVMRVQAHWRGLVQRRKYREMRARMNEKSRHDKARVIQKAFRNYHGRRQARMAIENANQPRVLHRQQVKSQQDKVLLQLSLRHYSEEDYRTSKKKVEKEIKKHGDLRMQGSVATSRRQKMNKDIERVIDGITFVDNLGEMSLTEVDEIVEKLPSVFTVSGQQKENFEQRMAFLRKTQARLRYLELNAVQE